MGELKLSLIDSDKLQMVVSQINASNLSELKHQFFSIGDGDYYITQSESPEIVKQYDTNGDKTVEMWEVMEGINQQQRWEIESRSGFRKLWENIIGKHEKPIFSEQEIRVTKEVYMLAKDLDRENEEIFTRQIDNYPEAFDFYFNCAARSRHNIGKLKTCDGEFFQFLGKGTAQNRKNQTAEHAAIMAGEWPITTEISTPGAVYQLYCASHPGKQFYIHPGFLSWLYEKSIKENQLLIIAKELHFMRELYDGQIKIDYDDLVENYMVVLGYKGLDQFSLDYIQSNDIPIAHVDLFISKSSEDKLNRGIYIRDFRNIIAAIKLRAIAERFNLGGNYPLFLILYGCNHYDGLGQELLRDETELRNRYLSFLSALPEINPETEPDFNRTFVASPCGKTNQLELENIWPKASGD